MLFLYSGRHAVRNVVVLQTLFLVAFVTVFSGGCAPDLGTAPFVCGGGTPTCPSGYECQNKLCVKINTCAADDPQCEAITKTDRCGDGVCQISESCSACASDCGSCDQAKCGNGVCETSESPVLCPADCPTSFCGDAVCDTNETELNCPNDCPPQQITPYCGDGTCNGNETSTNCASDCKPSCGNGVCEFNETVASCEVDCATCGDGKCTGNETKQTCASDCATCGDGVCDTTEMLASCPSDCSVCGDGQCTGKETKASCLADCAACGDGTCDATESLTGCPKDCSVCGDGKCTGNESSTSCSKDCTPPAQCTAGQTQCVNDQSLKYCDQNAWKTVDCESACTSNGFDFAVECGISQQTQKATCLCGDYGKFGDTCEYPEDCEDPLTCLSQTTGTSLNGFCSKPCSTPFAACSGGPSGTDAICLEISDGDLQCIFTCSDSASQCPSSTSCDTASELCLP